MDRLIWMIGRLAIPDEYQQEARSLWRAEGEERPLRVTTDGHESTQARREVLALNRSAGQLHNRLLRLKHFVEPLAAVNRLHLRPVVLAMNLVVDHIELLMEMHAALPRVTGRRSTARQPD